MGKVFYMHKIKEENGIYYYEVSDLRSDPTAFVVGIDARKKTVSYFLTVNDIQPVTVIDFNLTKEVIPVSPWDTGLATAVFFLAGFKAYTAIKNNHFPDHMGKYS